MLTGKIALVTGASSGIGLEIANVFLQNHAKVIGIDVIRRDAKTDNLYLYNVDISDYTACCDFFTQVTNRYPKIDVLVNCAGITKDSLTSKMSEDQFDTVINVNLKGVWNLTRLIGPSMQANKSGSIINISSVVAIYGNIGQANYAAAKSGIIGMTKSWAKEFAHNGGNVRVNALAPGYTMTNMLQTVPPKLLEQFASQTMLGRLAHPREIANAALFLASDLSSYITGTVIQVDGGMRL